MCTKSILNKADGSDPTDPTDTDRQDGSVSDQDRSEETHHWSTETKDDRSEDQNLDYFKGLVTSSPSKLINADGEEESKIERKLRLK